MGYLIDLHPVLRTSGTYLDRPTIQALERGLDEGQKIHRGADCIRTQAGRAESGVPAVEVCRKMGVSEKTLWTTDEARQFLGVATGHRLYAAFYLSMSTGLRCGELLGLHWEDLRGNSLRVTNNLVNLWGREGQKGRLIIQSPKTNKGVRRVVISPAVTGVLEQHRERQDAERAFLGEAWQEHGLVFASEVGTPLHPRNFARVWYGLQEKAGVTRVRLHDLRDLHVSLLVREGFDPQTIADRIGHTDPAFTLRQYSHAFGEQRQAAGVDIMDLLSSTTDTKNYASPWL